MKSYICFEKCTHGDPPRLFVPGDLLLKDGECPKHFRPGSVAVKAAAVEPDAGKTLGDAAPGPAAGVAADLAGKTAPEPCSVEELAEKLGVEVGVIKEASGKARKNEKLTSDEVAQVTAAVNVASGAAADLATGSKE